MAENIKFYSLKKPGFSLVELCVAILVFGVVARAIFYSNTLSYELLNSALKSQKLQSLNSAINIISAYYRSHIAQSVLSSEDKLLWVSANEYAQSSYLSLVDMSRSNREKIITKFKPSNILEAFSQSAGVDFASEFKVVAIFNGVSYNTSDFGYFGDNSLALVRASGDDILQIKPGYKGQISGAYTLASSAYALSFDKDSGAIWLYHDWHPWLDESLISAPKALIIDGLSGAKFSISEAGTEIELCIDEICAKEILL
ncbi:type II secretion system protein [Campylobacter sp. 19-13652]|uniref:type II secretion system protein n=1 Tax=Campylobacter sp. 19-13652 TaxID=2840180 RepID=UPI001C7934E0|nr:type II secretion system protein [Campylobacter sp. 19-13652]BCX79641.1 hypothetical protein LBC_11030 [Campylobacter sp. 19-13652]